MAARRWRRWSNTPRCARRRRPRAWGRSSTPCPAKFDTVVGERGHQLSSGERQRLALARAFLANPSVLVLDEPTAALDPRSERAVVEGYRAVMRGRTTLIISHRRDVAMNADRVVVLQDARVVQAGRPDELIVREGPFAALFGSPQATRAI